MRSDVEELNEFRPQASGELLRHAVIYHVTGRALRAAVIFVPSRRAIVARNEVSALEILPMVTLRAGKTFIVTVRVGSLLANMLRK